MDTNKTPLRIWTSFAINISLITMLFVLGIFWGMYHYNKRLIEDELLSRARAHFKSIVLTRNWNAHYGGVYVEKKAGVTSNPYLKNPDITTTDGRIFTLRNPAVMAKEISKLSEQFGGYQFRISSLTPINPENSPDPFEKEALLHFENDSQESFTIQTAASNTYYRYMAPLIVEESCLECHAQQGYKVGDIRGGISIRFLINDIVRALRINKFILALLSVGTLGILLSIFYFFIYRLSNELTRVYQQITEMAITDDLTGIANRRHFFVKLNDELSRAVRYKQGLSCLLIDIDFFKKINDTHGHLTGDKALKEMAATLQKNCRQSDTLARYGGEEFVVLLPGTTPETSRAVAEKIRARVVETDFQTMAGETLQLTVSIGLACCTHEELQCIEDADTLIKMADDALYRAKKQGRNQVVEAGE